MGVLSNLRGTGTKEAIHISSNSLSSSISSPPTHSRKKLLRSLPIFVALVVIAELYFLSHLEMAKNAALLVDSWADKLLNASGQDSSEDLGVDVSVDRRSFDQNSGFHSCEEWLEREDSVVYSRDFDKDPILVRGAEKEWKTCDVGCRFEFKSSKVADGGFGPQQGGTATIHRSMESSKYYAENNLANARRRGYDIVMTTSLSSDVPVGYFSWAEYDIMAPVQPKTEKALAVAFISNCAARNFRLEALVALEKLKIEIDSYGGCHRNREGNEDKVETLKRYRFSLAFENSNEEDYVTEKFFQSLVAGTIPVVVGAPNIEDFSPAPGAILHIKELDDVTSVAETMKYLADHPDAYNHSLRWKYEGPSDSFKALLDMAAVHSSCRLCIHLATLIRDKEEHTPGFKRRPCKCNWGSETVYHLYVRERGLFKMESVFLRSGNLTLHALELAVLEKFKFKKHVPIWKPERPPSIRGGDNEFKVYHIYPVGLTQRQALYAFKFKGDADFQNHLEINPCAKFEVIFV